MTFVCDILYYSMFENVFRCNIITLKQERHALNGFINHVSKSRNRDFCSRKSVEGRGRHMMFFNKGGPLNGGRNI